MEFLYIGNFEIGVKIYRWILNIHVNIVQRITIFQSMDLFKIKFANKNLSKISWNEEYL